MFWILIVVIFIIIVGVGVGAGVGISLKNKGSRRVQPALSAQINFMPRFRNTNILLFLVGNLTVYRPERGISTTFLSVNTTVSAPTTMPILP